MDLKSVPRKGLWVRIPPPALLAEGNVKPVGGYNLDIDTLFHIATLCWTRLDLMGNDVRR